MSLAGILHRGFGTSVATGNPPDVPVLSIADNADETATATVSGSSSGATNIVQTQHVASELGGGTWTTQGGRIGDGDVIISVTPGYYWARVVSTLNGMSASSNPVYFRVTDGSGAVLKQCLDAVQARIQGLMLDGLDAANIVVGKAPSDLNLTLPAIQITPTGREAIDAAEGTNRRDDVGYPVLVTIFAADNQDQTANLNQYLTWRQQIARAFRNQRLPGVSEIVTATVEPDPVVDSAAWFERNLFVSSLLIRFLSREPRGM